MFQVRFANEESVCTSGHYCCCNVAELFGLIQFCVFEGFKASFFVDDVDAKVLNFISDIDALNVILVRVAVVNHNKAFLLVYF